MEDIEKLFCQNEDEIQQTHHWAEIKRTAKEFSGRIFRKLISTEKEFSVIC